MPVSPGWYWYRSNPEESWTVFRVDWYDFPRRLFAVPVGSKDRSDLITLKGSWIEICPPRK